MMMRIDIVVIIVKFLLLHTHVCIVSGLSLSLRLSALAPCTNATLLA